MEKKNVLYAIFIVGLMCVLAWMVWAEVTDANIEVIKVVSPNATFNYSGNLELDASVNTTADNLTFIFYNGSDDTYIYNITINCTRGILNNTFNVTVNTASVLNGDGLYYVVVNGSEISNLTVANVSGRNLGIGNNFTVDNTAPSITAINLPLNNTFYSPTLNNELFVINVTITNDTGFSDIHVVNISNGTHDMAYGGSFDYFTSGYITRTTDNYFNTTWNATENLTEGMNVIYVAANDTAGNLNNSDSASANQVVIFLDTNAPTVELEIGQAHDNWTWTTDTTPTLSYNFTDSWSPNASCELFVDGTSRGVNGSVLNNTQTFWDNSTALSIGVHEWWVNCTDLGSNPASSGKNNPFYLDIVERPTLRGPANETWIGATAADTNYTANGTKFTFNFTSHLTKADSNAETLENASCELFVMNGSRGWNASSVNLTTNNNTDTDIYNNHTIAEGMNMTWYVNCTYNSTIIQSDLWTIHVDATAPTVELELGQTLENWTWTDDSTPTLYYNFTDGTSESADCELFVDGVGYNNTTAYNNTQASATVNTSLGIGDHTWYVNCTDQGSNLGTSGTGMGSRFTLEYGLVTITTPLNGTYAGTSEVNNGTKSFTFTYTSNITENATCELHMTNSSGVFVGYGVHYWGAVGNGTLNATSSTITNNHSLVDGLTTNWTLNCTFNGTQITAIDDSYYTLFADNTTPTVTVVSGDIVASSATITATTSETTSCKLSSGDVGWDQMTPFGTSAGTSHSASVVSLSASTLYHYYVRCRDNAANEVAGSTSFTTLSSEGGSGAGGSSGGTSSGVAGDFAQKTWASINAGETAIVTVTNGEIGVTEVSFAVADTTYGAWMKVERIDALPSTVKSYSGKVYKNVKISQSNVEKAMEGKATLKFKVAKSWLTENKIGKANVALFKYAGDKWNELSTKELSADADYVYYSAETTSFSYFVIGEKAGAVPLTEEEAAAEAAEIVTEEEVEAAAEAVEEVAEEVIAKKVRWGWIVTIVAAIIVLIALIYAWKRKK